ncbi:MAG: hypothetical protein WD554_01495 [Flavobacteriaceae bacterium]
MKNLMLMMIVFLPFAISAQSNENKKQETTVEKVTVVGTDVETISKTDVDTEKSVIKVEGTTETNQNAREEKMVNEKTSRIDVDSVRDDGETIDGVQRGTPTLATSTKEVIIDGKKCKCECIDKKVDIIE